MGCCGWTTDDATRPAPVADLLAVVSAHRCRAEADLLDVSGGRPLCRPDGAASIEPVKAHEGRLAALAELQRALRRANPVAHRLIAENQLRRWEHDLARSTNRGGDWLAYHRGGVAELRAILAEPAPANLPGRP